MKLTRARYIKYKRCVAKLEVKGKKVNPYAVCQKKVLGIKKPSKKWVDSPTFNPIRKRGK